MEARRGPLALGALLGTTALLCTPHPASALVRGLSTETEAKFQVGVPFTCSGPEGKPITLPYDALNDDYCDCADGVDEPGTGACAGQDTTLFHCHNEGSTPQYVYASRVDDGVCDCCDGSDEAGHGSRRASAACPNRCAELGEIEKKERAERMNTLREGLEKKDQSIKLAVANREQWTSRVQHLEASLPALEASLAEAKKASEAAKAADAAAGNSDALRAENEELKKTVAEQQAKIEQLQRELDKLKGVGGAADAKPEKKVVSEYAKWMDGAGDTPGAIEGQEDDIPVEDDEEGHMPSLATKPTVSNGASSTAPPAKRAEDDLLHESEKRVRDNKDETQKLKKKLDQMVDTHLGYTSLADKCINKHDGQYTYKLCFYDDAKQDHTSLGRWNGWVGPREAKFTDGQMCPGGPARMLRVLFECGSDEAVLDISEPSRCVYEARVTSPGACDESDVAKLERPPVKHPKDEL